MPFAGGIQQHGYQCGMIWGAALAAGAESYRRFGAGSEAEARAIEASRAVVEAFRPRHGEIDCFEITHLNQESSGWEQFRFFMLKGGTVGCFKMASWFAPLAKEAIEGALEVHAAASGKDRPPVADPSTDGDAEHPATPDPAPLQPVSCTAYLARTMGASDLHAVMASGLAGGVGLCGGACGALGTAIWLRGMKTVQEEGGKLDYRDPRSQEIVDRFLGHTEYTFECEKIVGRRFDSVDDHAAFVRKGGCAALLKALASRAD